MATPIVFDALARYFQMGFKEMDYFYMPTAFQSIFGRAENGSRTVFSPNANDLDIAIERMDETIAALVPRGVNAAMGGGASGVNAGIMVGRETAFSRKYPLTEEWGTISADQLNNRVMPDEMPYENWTREQRAQYLAQKIYKVAVQRHVRLQEVLAVQSATLGVQSASKVSDTTVNIYDWRRNSNLKAISLTHQWGYVSGGVNTEDPIADLDAWCDLIRFYGKRQPDMAVFGGTTMKNFIQNTLITTAYANHFYWNLIEFKGFEMEVPPQYKRFVDGGMQYFGQLRTAKGYLLHVFTYPELYSNANTGGSSTKYFSDTGLLVMWSGGRADRYFGPPERVPITSIDQAKIMERFGFNPAMPPLPPGIEGADNIIAPQMYYPDCYDDNQAKNMVIRVQAAPIYPTTMTDVYAYGTAGGTS